jgi:N-acetylglutamate synthase-like GNAT family acetyltransferase
VRACVWGELAAYHSALYDAVALATRDPAAAVDAYLEVGRLWIANEDDQVVGIAGTVATGSTAELEPVVVDRTARRRGIGRLLVEAAVADALAQGAQQVFVRPAARNVDAIRSSTPAGSTS